MKPDEDLDRALTDALNRRASAVHAPHDGRVRLDEHLAADVRHRHRRRVAMSVCGVVGVLALGAGAVVFATGDDGRRDQTVASGDGSSSGNATEAATDQMKIRVPSAPSGLPKMLPSLPEGWVLESANDFAPEQGTESPVTVQMLLYRSDDGAAAIRADIATDPNGSGFDPSLSSGEPSTKAITVRGQPAVLTLDPKGIGVQLLMWAEGPNTTVTVTARGLDETQLVSFAESLQPAAEGWSATALPAGVELVYAGDPNLPMGYNGPSWQLGYRGPEDLSQPQDPSIMVTATRGTIDALAAYAGAESQPVPTTVGEHAAISLATSDSPPYRTLVWFDPDTQLVVIVNASGVSEGELLTFASSMHPVSDAEWQAVVAPVLPKAEEPVGPVEPPVPTQPEALGTIASGTLPDGRAWTITATRYRDQPDGDVVCGDLTVGGDQPAATACANVDGTTPAGMSTGTDGQALVFAAVPASAERAKVEQSGADPIDADVVASGPADIPVHWVIAVVPDMKKVTAIVGADADGTEVSRVDQPFGAPYPDYAILERAPKREVATGVVDGAAWTLVAADAPLSDGSGDVTCVTLSFASEMHQTCAVEAVGGVNGSGVIDAVTAVLRKRAFVLAHLDAGVAKVVVDLDDGSTVGENTIDIGAASGSRAVVIRIPDGRTTKAIHAWDTDGNDLGAVDMTVVGGNGQPMPLIAEDSRSARPARG